MMERIEPTAVVFRRGSALILAVVLTSLLALVGVLFVMTARIDKMATSATADSRELGLAVDTVLAEINETLIADVPGVGSTVGYYDYPDTNNAWLAEAEPYQSGGNDYWRQISNVAGLPAAGTRNVRIRLVEEREPIKDPNGVETNADADGDGVGDAQWFPVPGVMSSKGRPIYAAVRVLDNGGMLNVNTGFKFDPGDANTARVDGRSQLQVNVLALASAPGQAVTLSNEAALLGARVNNTANPVALNLTAYEQQVLWQYPDQAVYAAQSSNSLFPYTPFDLSDELELRYRFLLNQTGVDTRLENWGSFRAGALSTPVALPSAEELARTNQTPGKAEKDLLAAWFLRVHDVSGALDPSYSYRPLATTYNMDRILAPRTLTTDTGVKFRKMVNVNTANELVLRAAVAAALSEADPNMIGITEKAIQITANLLDYIDDDDEITVVQGLSSPYYGFERPCLYLSELAYRQAKDPNTGQLHTSYAIELHRPYFEDNDPRPGDWKIVIDNPSTADVELDVVWSGSRRFHVMLAEDPAAPLTKDYVVFSDPQEPVDTMPRFGYDRNAYKKAVQD